MLNNKNLLLLFVLNLLLSNINLAETNKVMVDSTKIFTYQEFLDNLDGTINAPDVNAEFTDLFPYCNSTQTYPSPFIPVEFSALPFSTFCSNNVVNNITNRGTDNSYQVVVGGDFSVPPTGGATLEGRLAVAGNIFINKAPAPFRVGESISGTAVVSEPGDFLLVGGNASGTGRINTGASAFGTYNARIGGSNSLVINGATVNTNANFTYDIDTLLAQSNSMSQLMVALPSTGTFSSGFVGTNDSLEVFNLAASDVNGPGTLLFSNIAPYATVIINVSGETVNYQKSVYNGRANDPFAVNNSSDVDATVYNIVWNFHEAKTLNVISSPAEGIQGLILAPVANVDFRTNLNGRLIAGGNVDLNGSGIEFHNYPFTGDLSKVIATQVIRECVIAVDDFAVTPISTASLSEVLSNDFFQDIATTSVNILQGATNGIATINSDRTINYSPNVGFQGLDSIQYVLCDTADSQFNCDTATLTILVGLEAIDDDFVSSPDVTTTLAPLNNDVINPPKTAIDTLQGPKNGMLSINPNGTVNYTANTGFSGRDSIQFVVCDTSTGSAICDTSLAVIGVLAVIPEAVDDNHATQITTPINMGVLDNDTFGSINFLSIKLLTSTKNGSLTLESDLTYTYTPNLGFTGLDSFNYEICDTTFLPGVCDDALVIIVVEPKAVDDQLVTITTDPVSFFPLINDTINPIVTTLDTLKGPKNGRVTFVSKTEWEYVANENFVGLDTFKYFICDTSEVIDICDTALVVVRVNSAPPKAVDDICSVELNTSLIVPVLQNDILQNPSKTEISSIQTTSVKGGNAILNIDGTVSFTPQIDFRGLDTLSYTICDTSASPSSCDSADVIVLVGLMAVDDSLITGPGISVSSFVLANDIVNLTKTSISILPSQTNGVVSVDNVLQQVSYLPNNGFSGIDTINVLVCDTSKATPLCDTSLLKITTLSPPPFVVNDLEETFKNQSLTIDFLLNDVIPNPNTTSVSFLGSPDFGTITNIMGGSLTYLPSLDFVGRDSIKYILCDTLINPFSCDSGFVVISTIEKPAPIAVLDVRATPLATSINISVLDNDILPDRQNTILKSVKSLTSNGGTVNILSGNIVNYNPAPSFRGLDTLIYSICDTIVEPDLRDSALIIIMVAPDAVDDTTSVTTGNNVVVNLLANDTINEPYTTVDVISISPNGTLKDTINGFISYTPNDDFVGYDTLLVVVCDTSSSPAVCDTSRLIIEVLPSQFIANDDLFFAEVNTPISINILSNDLLSPLTNLSLSLITDPKNGTANLQTGFVLEYSPDQDYEGPDTLLYLVCDTILKPNLCDSATVIIDVIKTPKSINDTLVMLEDTRDSINVLLNDIEVFGRTLLLADLELKDTITNGAISWDSTGLVIFTPSPNYFGTITYKYVSQIGFLTDTALLIIIVEPVNDTPFKILEPELLTIINTGNTQKSPNVLLNNLDIENDDLFVKSIIRSQADFIGYTVSDSTISYLPVKDFIGVDTVLYEVCDRGSPEECMVDTLIVNVLEPSELGLFVPEAFSPNNDGINDVFEILGLDNFEFNSIKVFNRWGNTVFQQDNYQNKWDGVNNVSLTGRSLPSAAYMYVLELRKTSGERLIVKGSVFINR